MPPRKGWKEERRRQEEEAAQAATLGTGYLPGPADRAAASPVVGTHVEAPRKPPLALPQTGSDFAPNESRRISAPANPLSRVQGRADAVAPLTLGPRAAAAGLVPLQPGLMDRLTATIVALQKANRHAEAGQLEVVNLLLHEVAHKLPKAIELTEGAQQADLEDLRTIL